jgi:hypothetical protein
MQDLALDFFAGNRQLLAGLVSLSFRRQERLRPGPRLYLNVDPNQFLAVVV